MCVCVCVCVCGRLQLTQCMNILVWSCEDSQHLSPSEEGERERGKEYMTGQETMDIIVAMGTEKLADSVTCLSTHPPLAPPPDLTDCVQ